ncbi:MAG: tripartite tricarboxylate transporter substrate binding protein, partial [Pseudothermotoga sp.]
MKNKIFIVILLVVLAVPFMGLATDFPTKPVTIIVPWSAGGATDLIFRAIASVFPKYANGQPLVINN